MIPPKNTSPKTLAPAGTHIARVYQIIYLGTVKSPYMDKDGNIKDINEVRIYWELPTKTHVFKEGEEAKPFVVSKKMTLSMFKKATLRPFVEAALGVTLKDEEADKFDVDEIIGKACLLSVDVEDGEKGSFNVVKSAIPLPEGTTVPPQVNKTRIISFDKWDEKAFAELPEWLQKRIAQSKEYQKMTGLDVKEQTLSAEEVPF